MARQLKLSTASRKQASACYAHGTIHQKAFRGPVWNSQVL
jgi:hypothetical protein